MCTLTVTSCFCGVCLLIVLNAVLSAGERCDIDVSISGLSVELVANVVGGGGGYYNNLIRLPCAEQVVGYLDAAKSAKSKIMAEGFECEKYCLWAAGR